LRELVSNSADALDKIRFFSLTDSKALDSNPELKIYVKADKEKGIISIKDSGIGMTKENLIKNLGTVAKSGTAEFLKQIENQNMRYDLDSLSFLCYKYLAHRTHS
jgi:heat shock protein beta